MARTGPSFTGLALDESISASLPLGQVVGLALVAGAADDLCRARERGYTGLLQTQVWQHCEELWIPVRLSEVLAGRVQANLISQVPAKLISFRPMMADDCDYFQRRLVCCFACCGLDDSFCSPELRPHGVAVSTGSRAGGPSEGLWHI